MKVKRMVTVIVLFIFVGAFVLTLNHSLEKVNAESTSWINSGSNMYANVSGNVGIGTASPQYPLHLSKGAGNAAGFLNEATASDNDAFVTYKAASNTSGRRVFNFNTGENSPNRLDLRLLNDALTSSTRTIMSWNYDGNVGIGSVSPTAPLHIARGAGAAAGFLNEATATSNDASVTLKAAANTTGRRSFNFNTGVNSLNRLDLRLLNDTLTSSTRTIMSWSYDGNVGVGTTAPAEKLQVQGNFKINGNIVSDGDICIGDCQ